MKLTKLTALGALVASTLTLYGCGGSDGDNVTIEIDASVTGDTSGSSGVSETCPSWTTPKAQVDGTDVCALPSTILEDRNLTNDIIWLMEGRVTVGNGNGTYDFATDLVDGEALLNVDLSIQEGTQIQGASGTFANLVITRGSRIFARGSEAEPIVFSSDDDDLEGSGEWGGLVVHGFSYTNKCFGNDNGAGNADDDCNVDSEGESGYAGGFDAEDDSGIIQYVVITEGGFEFAPGNEINGLSLMSVGSGTTIDHIQINGNADDGVEFYGGTVNASHLVITSALDDSVDWDEGFQGTLQYVLVKQSDDSAGNAIEADTEGSTEFDSAPFVLNATFIGAGSKSDLHVMKASSGGFIVNAVMTGDGVTFADNCLYMDGAGAIANQGNALDYLNSIADCTTFAEASDASATTLGTGINSTTADLTALYASGNAVATLVADTDISAYEDAGAYPAALFDDLTADFDFIDTDGLGYMGAVDPAATEAWWDGWTLDGTL